MEAGLARRQRAAPTHPALAATTTVRSGSRRNIAAHYDLGNDFFRLFLDETMTYSCGIFETPGSRRCTRRRWPSSTAVCRKLELQPGDDLLEIGTGWGGFALHAAGNYGCRVTTTTISREQHDHAAARSARAGLGDRITLLLEDYRDLKGTYDKLVSIEMIEAVGHRYLDTYFGQVLDPARSPTVRHSSRRSRCRISTTSRH